MTDTSSLLTELNRNLKSLISIFTRIERDIHIITKKTHSYYVMEELDENEQRNAKNKAQRPESENINKT